MNGSEYVASFFLIILGFAVSEMLNGTARLMRQRKRIKFFWPAFLIVPFLFEILIFWFVWVFTMVLGAGSKSWSIIEIADISIQVIPWAFISYLIFPSDIPEDFDMKEFFFENAKVILVLIIFLAVYVIFRMIMLEDYRGIMAVIASLILNIVVFFATRKLFLTWLILSILLVNYFIFIAKPLTIG